MQNDLCHSWIVDVGCATTSNLSYCGLMPYTFALIPTVAVSGGQATLPPPPTGGDSQSVSALDAAKYWHGQGAARLEVIDLDAAAGRAPNTTEILRLIQSMRHSVHLDLVAGIHDDATLEPWRSHGAAQLVLSTDAMANLDFVARVATGEHGNVAVRLVLGDGGALHAPGTPADGLDVWQLLPRLADLPISNFIICDASHGTHWWQPHRDLLADFCNAVSVPVTAGSGVDTLEDLHHLVNLVPAGLDGAVVGRALTAGQFSYAEAITAIQARYDPYEWGPARP